MAASVFVLKRVFCSYCPQARSYLLQRGGCGQGGFVDGLTGAGVGVLWDGGHCCWKPGVQKTSAVMQNTRSCGGIRRTRALEHLKVTFMTSSCQDFSASQ